jgi:NifU-like protein involved in Fe-S cluster formation
VADASQIKNTDIAKELCLPPVKCEMSLYFAGHDYNKLIILIVHCSLLAEDAIKAAIANYQSKKVTAAASNLAGTSKAFVKET